MSFITKRERVFNEYETYDLPQRNEGKIKAHGSCTDNRAWSHFVTDKTEHLVDIIKRNNEICRPKYLPTEVIVNTLTRAKNAEIARLKRKIEEFEQLLAAYDQLELTPEQKAEIANAHDSIRQAYKDLEDLGLNLDLSCDLSEFTEGVDSEIFETGQSRSYESAPSRDTVAIIEKPRIETELIEKPRVERESIEKPRVERESIEKPRLERESVSKPKLDRESFAKPRVSVTGRDAPHRKSDQKRSSKSAPVPWSYGNDTVIQRGLQRDDSCYCDASTEAQDSRIGELQAVIVGKDAKLNAMQNTLAVMENDICEPYCIYAHIYTALEKIFAVLRQNEKYKSYIELLTAGKDTREIDITGRILLKLKILEKFSLALLSPCSRDESMKRQMCRCYDKIVSRVETAFALNSDEGQKIALENKRAQLVADIMQNEEMKEILSSDSVSLEPEDEASRSATQTYEVENYDIDTENLKRLKDLQQSYEELMNCYEDLKHEKTTMFVKLEKYKDVQSELEKMQNQLKEYCQLWHEKEHYKKRSQDLDYLKEQYLVLTDETSSLEAQLKAEGEINGIKNKTIDELRNCNLEMEQKLNDILVKFEREKNLLMCKLKETECKCMCQEQQIKTLTTQMDNLLEHNDSKFLSEDDADELESLTEQINNLKEVILSNEEEKQNIHMKYHEDIERLQKEMEEWKSKCNHILQRNEFLELSAGDLDRRNNELARGLAEKNDKVEHLLNIITLKAQEINKLSKALESKNSENVSLCHELNNIKQSFHSNLSSLENEKLVTQHSLQLAKQESLQLMEKVKCYDEILQKKEDLKKSFEFEKNTLEQEIEVMRNYNVKTVNAIQQLEKERNECLKELEASDAKNRILLEKVSEIDNVKQQLKNLQATYEQLLQEKNGLERQLFEKSNELLHAFDSIAFAKKESNEMLSQSESLKDDIANINEAYRKSLLEKQDILEILSNKDKELTEISNTLNNALEEKTAEVDNLRKELEAFKATYQMLVAEKDTLQKEYEAKTEEANELNNKIKDLEYNDNQAKRLTASLEEDNIKLQDQIKNTKRESEVLSARLEELTDLEKKYEELEREYATEKDEFRQTIETLEFEKQNLYIEKQGLIRHSEDIENALMQTTDKANTYAAENDQLLGIQKEIEELRNEKLELQKTINNLKDKIDVSENTITNYLEEIEARDNNIIKLENNRNELEDIIKQLQEDLKQEIRRGEQIRKESYERIETSKKNVEAHPEQVEKSASAVNTNDICEYILNRDSQRDSNDLLEEPTQNSKAVHNMSLELAKLKNEKLKERLSESILESEQSFEDTQNDLSEKKNLENDREVIVCQIKQLELTCVGNSDLSPEHCSTEQVLESLRRAENSYESLLSKAQTTSQFVINKADEAQKIAEKEKLKISKDKEEALKQKQKLEQEVTNLNAELASLKQQLADQKLKDLETIENLGAELSNQQLIVDRLNKTTQIYTDKLTDDLKSLQDTYKDCLNTIDNLKQTNLSLSEDNDAFKKMIEDLKEDLQRQTNEIQSLEQHLRSLQRKPRNDVHTQIDPHDNNKDNETQTEVDKSHDDKQTDYQLTQMETQLTDNYVKKNYVQNKVQVLRADVSPNVDFVNNSYNKSQEHDQGFPIQTVLTDSSKGTSTNTVNSDEVGNSMPHSEILKTGTNVYQENENSKADDLFMIYKESENAFDKNNPSIMLSQQSNTVDSMKSKVKIYPQSKKVRKQKSMKKKEMKHTSDEDDSVKTAVPIMDYEKALMLSKKSKNTKNNNNLSNLVRNAQSSVELSNRNFIQESPSLQSNTHTRTSEYDSKIFNRELEQIDKVSKYSSETDVPRANVKRVNKKVDPIKMTINKNQQKTTKPDQETFKSNTEIIQNHKLSRVNANLSIFEMSPSNKNDEQNLFDMDLSATNLSTKDVDSKPLKAIRSHSYDDIDNMSAKFKQSLKYVDTETKSVMAKLDHIDYYESEIERLNNIQQNLERDHKKKMEAIKIQYDNHIKTILGKHNQGVSSLQNLHEETLQDILKMHENEVDNLRSMSIEAMKKADKLEKENKALKYINKADHPCLDEEPIKIVAETKKRHKTKHSTLTKTRIQKLEINPKLRSLGPCTCSIDANISETIRKIFEQADLDQTKNAEHSYLRFIATKLLNENIDALDAQELSFLHLKVCRTWKQKLTKEQALQKKIDCLEMELINRQRYTHSHIAELDRKVAEERRRLEEVREAVCKGIPSVVMETEIANLRLEAPEERSVACTCITPSEHLPLQLGGRRSAGDLMARPSRPIGVRIKRRAQESNRAVLIRMDAEERRDKRLYDEQPVRLRKSTPDRPARLHKNKS